MERNLVACANCPDKKREGYVLLFAAALASSAVALASSTVASSSVGVLSVGVGFVGSVVLRSGYTLMSL